jgi:hypothetical protein
MILITAVLGLSTALVVPATAGAAKQSLELQTTTGVLTSGTRVDTEMNFTFTSSRGPVECRTYSEGPITNGLHIDAFTAEVEHYECEGAGASGEGATGVSALTLGIRGRATSTVTVGIDWPAPDEACTYSGKLKGTNTLAGELNATLAGKLSSSGCDEHRVTVESNYWYTYAAHPGWEQLEDFVS